MNNMWLSALSGLFFFVTALHGSPLNADTDVITADEDGVVYVLNVYAVKNVKSKVLGRMLSHHALPKMPSNFEPIGSILVSSDETEPMNLSEISYRLEDWGISVDKMDHKHDPKVIEIKFDFDMSDLVVASIEIQLYLQTQGIIVNAQKEEDRLVIQIVFDESIMEHLFTPEALGNYLESEGLTVEYTRHNGNVVSIKIMVDVSSEESDEEIEDSRSVTIRNDEKVIEKKNERRIEINSENEVQKISDRKIDNKIGDNDDLDIPLDFVTRSESLNKIRRRRSACPECKTGNLIKQYINNYSGVH